MMKALLLSFLFVFSAQAQEVVSSNKLETRYFQVKKTDSLIRVMYFQAKLPLPLILYRKYLRQVLRDNQTLSYYRDVFEGSIIKLRIPAGTPLDSRVVWLGDTSRTIASEIPQEKEKSEEIALEPQFPEFSFEDLKKN